jgi:hypothetical protein
MAAWRQRIMFYRSAANVRLLPAVLYVALAACDIWVVEHGHASGMFALLAQAVAVYWITRFRMRTPRGAVSWGERYKPLPDYLKYDKVHVAVKIVPGTRGSARVRGRLTSPVVLVSNRTALAWEDNHRVRDVQWAHESAHIGMGDAYVYYLMSSAVGLALFNQVIGNWRSLSNEFVLAAMAFIAIVSMRAYCRTRELAADSMASIILSGKPKEELAKSTILDANQLPFVRTHPSVNERLAVLEEPITMLNGAAFFYFAAGFMAVSVAIALHRVLHEWNTGEASVFANLVIISLIIGWSTSRHSAMASMTFSTRRWITLFPMLSIGELSSFVMHDPSLVRTHHFLTVIGWSIAGSIVAALIGKVAGFAAVLLSSTSDAASDSFFRVTAGLRVVTAILAAAAWIAPWFV